MSVDLVYLTANRREFTELSFEMLVRNTNWDRVDRLIAYDDRSQDGAKEEVTTRFERIPVPCEMRAHEFGSPVAVMNDYIATAESKHFVKVDNDLVLPPGWLDVFLQVLADNPRMKLLGAESPFMGPPPPDFDGRYTVTRWRHIGGNGLMQTQMFKNFGPMDVEGRHHGFTGYQWRHNPDRGWITPDILCCLLDRCPIEPWRSISETYVKRGWQRRWGMMDTRFSMYWDWFTEAEEAAA